MKIFEKLIRRAKHFVANPSYMMKKLLCRYIPNYVSDKWYLEVLFFQRMGYYLDLKHPKTFNEKLQWLKLYDRNPLYTTLVDKYRVKQWVADKIGEEYVIPTLAVYQSVDEIDLDKLPNQFVLKCNHDSGSVVICRDKATFDLEAAKIKLQKGLETNYYDCWREWPYKNVKRCIIAEQYLESISTQRDLIDYKFYCFHSEPHFLYVSQGMENHHTARINYVNLDWTSAPFHRPDYKEFEQLPSQPQWFNKMIHLCKCLSQNIPFVRVDLYEVDEQIYLSEMTFAPGAGFNQFEPLEWDYKIGDILKLPDNK